MVKMNGFAATRSVRPFRFWADKAAFVADFHLENGTCYYGETKNSKHSRCTYTLRFLQKSVWLAKSQLVLASRARRYPHFIFAFNSNAISAKIQRLPFCLPSTCGLSKQCTAVPTCAYLLGNIPNPLTISEKLATHRWCFVRLILFFLT